MKPKYTGILPIIIAILAIATGAFAQSTEFTYQGQLNDNASAASGSYDMTFRVYDALGGGSQVGGSATILGIAVSNGLFTVNLDFGSSVFTGADRWLEIGVQTNGGGGFTTLSPRTKFTSAPYAITADTAANVPAGSIGSSEIANSSVTAADLGPNSVGTSEVINNSLTASDLATGSVGSSEVLDNSLTAADLASNSVGGSELASSSVGSAEIINNSVGTLDIQNGSITTADLNLSNIDSRYVEVAGDTMTGKLLIEDTTTVLDLRATGSNPMLRFLSSTGSQKAWIQSHTNNFYLANSQAGNLFLRTSNLDRMTIDSTGRVGIGTTSPSEKLHIFDAANAADVMIEDSFPFLEFNRAPGTGNAGLHFMSNGTHTGWLYLRGSDNVLAMSAGPSAIVQEDLTLSPDGLVGVGRVASAAKFEVEGANTNDTSDAMVVYNSASANLLHVENSGQVGIGYGFPSARLWVQSNGTEPIMRVRDSGSTKFYINGDGQVCINSLNDATGYALSVDGKIACEEVLVQDSGSWPDYVFAEDYNLRPLAEVEAHIKANKRLPGIPSADKVEKEGISVGDMQKSMMEKIEELTLYILEQDKRIAELESQLK